MSGPNETVDGGATTAVDDRVEATKAAYAESLAEARFEPLAEYVTEDVAVLRPGHAPIEGREAWGEHFDAAMADVPPYDATYTTDERFVTDELVVERGICREGPVGAEADEYHEYNYLWLFRLEDGEWRISHKAWNRID